jgi:hypothetical protein
MITTTAEDKFCFTCDGYRSQEPEQHKWRCYRCGHLNDLTDLGKFNPWWREKIELRSSNAVAWKQGEFNTMSESVGGITVSQMRELLEAADQINRFTFLKSWSEIEVTKDDRYVRRFCVRDFSFSDHVHAQLYLGSINRLENPETYLHLVG